MKINNNLCWLADAHVFYNTYLHKTDNGNEKILADELTWRINALNNTPNGELLIKNSFFDNLKNEEKIYLAHITPNLDDILKNKNIQPSGGCLVGSIYCTHLSKEDKGLRMHNLGRYILKKEAPNLLRSNKLKSLGVIIIEIKLSELSKNNLIGIDYLRLGEIHFNIYEELKYLLSHNERNKLKEVVVSRARRSLKYLNLCTKYYYYDQKINPFNFIKAFIATIDYLPILGYLWFEILSEYIMLYQDNTQSLACKKQGEFYSDSYKNLIPYQYPTLPQKFSLRQFNPDIESLKIYFNKNHIFKKLDIKHLISYLTDRIVFLTNARLLSPASRKINWNKSVLNFDDLSFYATPLIGHLIHRELRSFGRYPHFYFYFDQYKALQI